ncbi:signal peptidase I, partial [Gleimia europaea]|nr:signal peptidase I [Gleimia europaea]
MQDFDAIVRRQRRSPESEATYQPRHVHPDSENQGKSAKKTTVRGRVGEVLLILVLAVILSS